MRQRYENQRENAQSARHVTRKQRAPAAPAQPSSQKQPSPSAQQPLRHMLSSRDTLRQAIILHEVIGPPKALRSNA